MKQLLLSITALTLFTAILTGCSSNTTSSASISIEAPSITSESTSISSDNSDETQSSLANETLVHSASQVNPLEIPQEDSAAKLVPLTPDEIELASKDTYEFLSAFAFLAPYLSEETKNEFTAFSVDTLVFSIKFYTRDDGSSSISISYGQAETDNGIYWHGDYSYDSDGMYNLTLKQSLGDAKYGPAFNAKILLQKDPTISIEDAFYITILKFEDTSHEIANELIDQKIFLKNWDFFTLNHTVSSAA